MNREEAIEIIKERIAKEAWCLSDTDMEALFEVIPELKKIDDEKIRKAIKCYIEDIPVIYSYIHPGIGKKEMLSYLEKQKDSDKAIDAVERIDKYIDEHTANAHDMDDSHPDKKYYSGVDDTLSNIAGILNSAYSEEEQKEQKDYEGDFTIYHPLKNGKGKYECIPYSFYGSLTSFSEDKDLIDFLRTCFYTEEECNEWIERQKEQKPVEYLDKDKVYAIMTKLTNLSYSQLIPINSDEFKKLHEITKDVRSLLDYPIEQKPAEWSKEDEKMLKNIEYVLHREIEYSTPCGLPSGTGTAAYKYQKEIDWLKSLPERFNLQPKQEWGEEDEEELQNAIDCLEYLGNGGVYASESGYDAAKNAANWLKSLRPQYHGDVTMTEAYKMGKEAGEASHWKPSEEQMAILEKAVHHYRNDWTGATIKEQEELTSLYNDLKKL